jgi:hypothetical protein
MHVQEAPIHIPEPARSPPGGSRKRQLRQDVVKEIGVQKAPTQKDSTTAMRLQSNGAESPPSPTPLRPIGVGAGEASEKAGALPPRENDTTAPAGCCQRNWSTARQLRLKEIQLQR